MLTTDLEILLVEDNPGDARLFAETLREIPAQRFLTTHVATLASALETLATRRFHVGLLDLGLPDALGLEVVQRIHQAAPDLALIVLTALQDESVAVQSLSEGAQDYLVKAEMDSHLIWRALRYAMERQRRQLELQNQSLVDDLTGLNNRKGFVNLANHHIAVSHRTGRPFLIGFVDLDGMKHINDTYGHQEGNRALVEAATVLRDSLRQSDILARVGGDEFALIVTDAEYTSAQIVIERVTTKVRQRNAEMMRPYALSLSIGVVSSQDVDSPSLDDLLSRADELMYRHKQEGGRTRGMPITLQPTT